MTDRQPERYAPVQGITREASQTLKTPRRTPWRPPFIHWGIHAKAWEQYAKAGHGRQDAERVAARGGFSADELDLLHPSWLAEFIEHKVQEASNGK